MVRGLVWSVVLWAVGHKNFFDRFFFFSSTYRMALPDDCTNVSDDCVKFLEKKIFSRSGGVRSGWVWVGHGLSVRWVWSASVGQGLVWSVTCWLTGLVWSNLTGIFFVGWLRS